MRELEDRMAIVVDDVDVLLWIVGADVDRMWTAQDLVPLRPVLDDVAVAIDHEDAVLPQEVLAVDAAIRIVTRFLRARLEERSGRARVCRIAPHPRHREGQIRRDVWSLDRRRTSALRRD